MNETLHVCAVGDARLPVPGVRGRFVGRVPRSHELIAEGVHVPADGYHLRAIARGDIALMPAAKAASKKVEAKS